MPKGGITALVSLDRLDGLAVSRDEPPVGEHALLLSRLRDHFGGQFDKAIELARQNLQLNTPRDLVAHFSAP